MAWLLCVCVCVSDIAICDTNCHAMLDKLIVSQLVKKFPTVCETQRFITIFIRAGHLSLSWARSVQFIPSNPVALIQFIVEQVMKARKGSRGIAVLFLYLWC